MKYISTPCIVHLLIQGGLLTGTYFLAYEKGQNLYDTGAMFVTVFWFTAVVLFAAISFLVFLGGFIIKLCREISAGGTEWNILGHMFCMFATVALPVAMVSMQSEVEEQSRLKLFERVGIWTIQHETKQLCANYRRPEEKHGRCAGAQELSGDELPPSYQQLGIYAATVYRSHVDILTGGMGAVRTGYRFYPPSEEETEDSGSRKIADGIFYWVLSD